MRRLRLFALFVFALLATAVAFVALFALRHDLASILSTHLSKERVLTRDPCGATCRLALSPAKERTPREPAAPEAPTFDAVQVSPDGPSVFAGRAPPGSHVAVLANERPIRNRDSRRTWRVGGGDREKDRQRRPSICPHCAARQGRRTDLRPDRRKVGGVATSQQQQGDASEGQRSCLAWPAPQAHHLRLRSDHLHSRGPTSGADAGRIPANAPTAGCHIDRPRGRTRLGQLQHGVIAAAPRSCCPLPSGERRYQRTRVTSEGS